MYCFKYVFIIFMFCYHCFSVPYVFSEKFCSSGVVLTSFYNANQHQASGVKGAKDLKRWLLRTYSLELFFLSQNFTRYLIKMCSKEAKSVVDQSFFQKPSLKGLSFLFRDYRINLYNFLRYQRLFKRSNIFRLESNLENKEYTNNFLNLYNRNTTLSFYQCSAILIAPFSTMLSLYSYFRYRFFVSLNSRFSVILKWFFLKHIWLYSNFFVIWRFVFFFFFSLQYCVIFVLHFWECSLLQGRWVSSVISCNIAIKM